MLSGQRIEDRTTMQEELKEAQSSEIHKPASTSQAPVELQQVLPARSVSVRTRLRTVTWLPDKYTQRILLGVAVLGIFFLIGLHSFKDRSGYMANVLTGGMGIVASVFVIDQLAHRLAEQREKATLILQLGSPNSLIATEAARALRVRGWHEDGTLQRARLMNADLSRASLHGFDLTRSVLVGANLENADLYGSHLQYSDFKRANLTMAILENADLREAILESAVLRGADLRGADLRGARTVGADMKDIITDADTQIDRLT